ncbi:C40 family peptidase [Catellatospora tritici]|uniref:C40 family peptidase n=1 Tax=Catellatospora tritici TaxID=2851566 RepID=UPI001C2D77AA|nr:C40 family peptidase [Catellatospora tritici]MBV1853301.1 C40 family peptidase [Catellatospora tritici]
MSPLRTARRRPRRLLLLAAAMAASLLSGLFVGLVPATPAHAEPSLAEIEAEIAKQWNQLEPIIEEYNKAHSDLLKSKKKAAAIDAKLQPLRLTVEVTRTRVGAIAAEYYKGGRNQELNSLLSSGSPKQFAEQLSILTYLAHSKQEQISATTEAKAKFDQQKAELDAIIVDQAKKDAEVGAKKKAIETEVNRLQALRLKAYGSGAPGGDYKIGKLCPATAIGGDGQKVAVAACKQIGKSYVFGDPEELSKLPQAHYDCSGLTQWAWYQVGVKLTHYTKDQWTEGKRVSTPQTGDLVFFFPNDGLHHVGLYVGKVNGRGVMVHAPHTGDVVRMAYIDTMPIAGYIRPS